MIRFLTFALAALAAITHPLIQLPDVDGVQRRPLKVEKGHATALFFVTNDCPISNYYSREIHRICDDFSARGLSCALVYTDPTLSESVQRLTARGPTTFESRSGEASGSTVVTIREGNAMVLVAKRNADGSVTRRCVSEIGEIPPAIAAPSEAGAER